MRIAQFEAGNTGRGQIIQEFIEILKSFVFLQKNANFFSRGATQPGMYFKMYLWLYCRDQIGGGYGKLGETI